MIPALVLAAGSGRRMGGPKALLAFEGETLLQRTIRVAEAAGCAPVIAVVGEWDPGPLTGRVTVIPNLEAAEGMASSIRAGIAALNARYGDGRFLLFHRKRSWSPSAGSGSASCWETKRTRPCPPP